MADTITLDAVAYYREGNALRAERDALRAEVEELREDNGWLRDLATTQVADRHQAQHHSWYSWQECEHAQCKETRDLLEKEAP